ncbi:hypothetical protein S7335_9 [Synechococcus sp. PCC 7335]|nr:hypothetical protein S7335_9 [Synechococcus sp. PCC 7335]
MRSDYINDMPKRVHLTLPDPVHDELVRWATARGQAIATVGAIALEIAIKQAREAGEIPPAEVTTVATKKES